jgi:enterochelin esterase-like enzyme
VCFSDWNKEQFGMKFWLSAAAVMLFALPLTSEAQTKMNAQAMEKLIHKQTLSDAEAMMGAEQIRAWFDAKALSAGAMRTEGMTAVWAIEAPNAKKVTLKRRDGSELYSLRKLGGSNIFAYATTLPDGSAIPWFIEADGQRKGAGQVELFVEQPEMKADANVPKGEVRQMPKFMSKIFDGTERDWWLYIPAQYKAESPACVMVFQDGQWAKNYTPPVFDNLIAKGQMPVTVGIFITPGTFAGGRSNRSFEYDTLSDQYVRFLLEEILPEAEKSVKLRHDAASRAIAGISSGGICAFTAAWERPNEFSKVLSWVGSFTGIATRIQDGRIVRPGGDNYPSLIRKTEKKPIRVFLQDGLNDLDNEHGSWPYANYAMDRALNYKGYDYHFVMGNGFHSDRHGRAIMPESLRWLWRDYKPE